MGNNKISIMLQIGMPDPAPDQPVESKPSVEDVVRQTLDCIDSGRDSNVEWNMIRRLYNELCSRKQTPRIANLKNMIETTLRKYGYHEVIG